MGAKTLALRSAGRQGANAATFPRCARIVIVDIAMVAFFIIALVFAVICGEAMVRNGEQEAVKRQAEGQTRRSHEAIEKLYTFAQVWLTQPLNSVHPSASMPEILQFTFSPCLLMSMTPHVRHRSPQCLWYTT